MEKYQKYFLEWVAFDPSSEQETEEAIRYLDLWKKFFLAKLQSEICEVKLIDTQIVDRYSSQFAPSATKVMKICVEADFKKTLDRKYRCILNLNLLFMNC